MSSLTATLTAKSTEGGPPSFRVCGCIVTIYRCCNVEQSRGSCQNRLEVFLVQFLTEVKIRRNHVIIQQYNI